MKDKGAAAADESVGGRPGWFGMPVPVNGELESQIKRVQSFTSDVQKAYLEAFSRQMESVNTTNQRFAHLVQGLAQLRHPQDAMVEAADLAAALFESASDQSRTWSNFALTLQDRCAAIARETAESMHKQTAGTHPPKPPA